MKDKYYYYNILGLDQKATYEMIKKSFRKLSLKYHPDCNKSSDTTEKYKEIVEAYENLCKLYEKNNQNENNQNENNQNENNQNKNTNNQNQTYSKDLNNIFNMFTSYSKHNIHTNINILNKPIPIIHNIDISIFQSYTGCLLPVNIERWLLVDNNKTKEKETLYINIPKGIDNNEIIIIKNKGNIINESNIGDVKIIIHIINETKFKREGLNLFYYHSITLKEALCGLTFKLESISGEKLTFENSKTNIITPNKTIKVKNKGMQREHFCGDLIVQFNIVFPEKLSVDKIDVLEKLL